MFEHVVDALPSEEVVGVFCFTQAVEEERQIVMVVQLLDLNLKKNMI